MTQQTATDKTTEYSRFANLDKKLRQFLLEHSRQILAEWAEEHGIEYQILYENETSGPWIATVRIDGKVIEAQDKKKKIAALKCWQAIFDRECDPKQCDMNKLKQSNNLIKQQYKSLEIKYKKVLTMNINANNNNSQEAKESDDIDTKSAIKKLKLILLFVMSYLVIMSHTEYNIQYYYLLIIAFIVFIALCMLRSDRFLVYLSILMHIGVDCIRLMFEKYMNYIQDNDNNDIDREQKEALFVKNAILLNKELQLKYDKLDDQYKDLKLKKEALKEEHMELQNKYNGLNINHISMTAKYVGLQEEYQCKTQKLEELEERNKQYMDQENKINSLQYENNYLEQQCKALEANGNRMKNRISTIRITLDEIKDIELDRNELDDKYQDLSMEYQNLTNVNKQLNNTIIYLKTRMDLMECDNNTVITDISVGEKCIVCYERGQLNACIPCGHLCVCDKCKREYYKNTGICPRCNNQYTSMIKIYT